ncbi:glycosyltransferase, partial [Barnesiella sp. WM24]|uniref:glycosyltransferase n=1 Tax=Barnesiella sp. WM24 TaxID=2558278 RepID=UPI00142FAF24
IGSILNPKTGGEYYDNRLYQSFRELNPSNIEVITDKSFSKNRLELSKELYRRINNSDKNDITIYNTAIFPYIIFALFRNSLSRNKKVVLGIHHHFRFKEQSGFKRLIFYILEKLCLKLSTDIICPNPYIIDGLKKIGCNKVTYIGHPFEHKVQSISNHEKFKFLYVGTVYERKGLTYLIDAINLLPDKLKKEIELNIVGETSHTQYVDNLRTKINEYNLDSTIFLRGRVSKDDLNKYYCNAYCFLFPSLYEGYGLVIEEAMSYGLPVIAFNNSAIPYTIHDKENGLLANNRDSLDFARKIELAINDETLYEVMCKGALHSYSKSHSLTDFKKEINTLYTKLQKTYE